MYRRKDSVFKEELSLTSLAGCSKCRFLLAVWLGRQGVRSSQQTRCRAPNREKDVYLAASGSPGEPMAPEEPNLGALGAIRRRGEAPWTTQAAAEVPQPGSDTKYEQVEL